MVGIGLGWGWGYGVTLESRVEPEVSDYSLLKGIKTGEHGKTGRHFCSFRPKRFLCVNGIFYPSLCSLFQNISHRL